MHSSTGATASRLAPPHPQNHTRHGRETTGRDMVLSYLLLVPTYQYTRLPWEFEHEYDTIFLPRVSMLCCWLYTILKVSCLSKKKWRSHVNMTVRTTYIRFIEYEYVLVFFCTFLLLCSPEKVETYLEWSRGVRHRG